MLRLGLAYHRKFICPLSTKKNVCEFLSLWIKINLRGWSSILLLGTFVMRQTFFNIGQLLPLFEFYYSKAFYNHKFDKHS